MVFSFRSARSSQFRRRTAQGCSQPTMDAGDWRTQLQPDSRQRIVNKIMDTLKRHLPFTGEEGLLELRKIAVRFEEKIYTAATSPSDYLRRISLKMLTMENKHQNFVASSPPLNAASNITKPPHTDSKPLYNSLETYIPPHLDVAASSSSSRPRSGCLKVTDRMSS
ncbi:hypothetical protein HYC85_008178 [Camellia sinensis]|uniref:Mediator complex subunit 15 KIX domain-containing protein n=1 Tax=Camellia sinensis TaxID=4442 RepID=A0A7J7HR31_CAMSI|nr:hypothetical protein HYC85_008178 [Camellia sinensis]